MTSVLNTRQHRIPKIEHGRRPRTRGVVVHVMDGYFSYITTWFSRRDNRKGIGTHLAVGLKSGDVVQMADLDAICYHAPGDNMADPGQQSGNYEFVGIEHEGFGTQSMARWVARRTQRVLSANRTAWILYHYHCGAPKWGHNVVRHSEFSRTTHRMCPGPGFPTLLYMAAVKRAYRNLVNSRGRTWNRT